MDLSHLSKTELETAFKQAIANKESTVPYIEEMSKRMGSKTRQKEVEIVDPGAEGICISCE